MKNKIIKTKIKYYKYDISVSESNTVYKNLCAELKAKGLVLFDSISLSDYQQKTEWFNKIKELEKKGIVELETKYLFDNQWNTTEVSLNLRVFDWAEERYPNRSIKEGYYLIVTDEMKDIRENTFKCGYCGKQYHPKPEYEFCMNCLDSEYLKKKDLLLLRLTTIADSEFKKLTDKESKYLIPLYTDAQIKGRTDRGKERIKKLREKLLKNRDKDIKNANVEYDGFIWLMDRGIKTNNVIYYDHTEIFSFGWRKELSSEEKNGFKQELKAFPFKYEFK